MNLGIGNYLTQLFSVELIQHLILAISIPIFASNDKKTWDQTKLPFVSLKDMAHLTKSVTSEAPFSSF